MTDGNIELTPGLYELNYIGDKNHYLIQNSNLGVKNIGINGENLTLLILSLNRSVLTIRLLNSIKQCIPDFKGEILIVDNGSNSKEIVKLKSELKKITFKNSIIELHENQGPSRARNIAIQHVNTDWVLSLDNDIYLINNPIQEIYNVIYKFGCHFLNLPLLDEEKHKIYALGGHIYIYNENSSIMVSGGSPYEGVYRDENFSKEPFLSTFLYAGASVINKNTFIQLGGYDENLFAFEDVDFSVRLFQKGFKIGNCGKFSMVHDHKKPVEDIDKGYENMRYSEELYIKSGTYFEKKHDMCVLHSGVGLWLKERRDKLDLNLEKDFYINNKNPDVSIILLYNNQGEFFKKTIDSIINSKNNLTFEIIVLDDNSEGYSSNFLEKYNEKKICNINLVKTTGIGCARAGNEGAKLANGEYLFFCDGDIKVSDYWLDNLVASLKNFKADLVAPCICDMNDNKIKIYGGTFGDKMDFKWITHNPQRIKYIPMFSCGVMAITKKAFQDIEGFDNLFKGYGLENKEISIRAWLYGYKIIINPCVEIKYVLKDKYPYKIYDENNIYNILCMNYYYFKRERIEKSIDILKHSKFFTKSIKYIKEDLNEILIKRERYMKKRVNDDDFFFERFNINF